MILCVYVCSSSLPVSLNVPFCPVYTGLVIVCHITETPFSAAQTAEMIRYLRNVQNQDGGWGL